MTWVRATGSLPMTAASASLGFKPEPGLATRATFGLATFATGTFLAATFLAAGLAALSALVFTATVLPNGVLIVAGPVLDAAGLRGGNLDGANSKFT